MKANKPNFAKTDLQIEKVSDYPEIDDKIGQVLARLMAYDDIAGLNRTLLSDPDGRLYVSTSATRSATASQSQQTVSLVSVALIGQNSIRKSLYIQNLGANPIFLGYGTAAVLNNGIQIPSGGIFIEDRFTGAINAISAVAGNDVRMLEM